MCVQVLKIVEAVMVTSMAKQRVRSMNLEHLERAQRAMMRLLERFRSNSISRATGSVYGMLQENALHVMQHQKQVSVVDAADANAPSASHTAAAKDRAGVVSVNNPLKALKPAAKNESGGAIDDSAAAAAGSSSIAPTAAAAAASAESKSSGAAGSTSTLDCVDVYKMDSASRRRSCTESHISSLNADAAGAAEAADALPQSAPSAEAHPNDVSPLSADLRQFSSGSVTAWDTAMPVALGPAQMESTEAVEAAAGAKEDEGEAAVIRVAFQSLDSTEFEVPKESFDHNSCADCSCVFEMANECSMRLAATKMRAKESTERLIKLQNYRDRMKADADLLEHHGWDGDEVP